MMKNMTSYWQEKTIIPKHAFEVDKSPEKKPYYTYKEI